MRLIEFAAIFATFEESLCYTRSVRQAVPREGGPRNPEGRRNTAEGRNPQGQKVLGLQIDCNHGPPSSKSPGAAKGRLPSSLIPEFRDVVFEDVVFDNNICYLQLN